MSANEIMGAIITSQLTKQEISRIFDCLKSKRKLISAVELEKTKAELNIGTKVSLSGLTPKKLNGIKGTVVNIKQTRADIKLLDNVSTLGLERYVGLNRTLRGVPIACLNIQED